MSVETRTLRPFDPPAQFDEALKLARFHMGEQVCEPDSRLVIESAEDFLRAKPALSWADDDAQMARFRSLLREGAAASSAAPRDLGLVVLIYTSYLQIADVPYCIPLSECASTPRLLSFAESRPRSLQASTHGAVVSAHVALLRKQLKRPLQPWRKGTWLAKTAFRLTLSRDASLFHPTPLTDEKRSELGLPRQAMRYVEIDDLHNLLRPVEDTELPTFYVDEELLARLNSEPASPFSKALQAQLVLDFMATAVALYNSDREATGDWDDLKDSLLGRIVRVVAGGKAEPTDCQEMLRRLERNPADFMARAEGALKLRRTLLNAFADPQ